MRKIYCLVCLTFFFLTVKPLSSLQLFALGVANPLDPALYDCNPPLSYDCDRNELLWDYLKDNFHLRVGYDGDFVYDRHMKNQNASIRQTKIITNACYLAIGFWDQIDFSVTLGATNLYINTPSSAFPEANTNSVVEIQAATHFSYGLGLKCVIWQSDCFGVGTDIKYFSYRSHLNFVALADQGPTYFPQVNTSYWEYQFSLGASYILAFSAKYLSNKMVPYVAIKWSRARFSMQNYTANLVSFLEDLTLLDMKNQRNVGGVIGLTFLHCLWFSATAEARFGDEVALHVNGQIRF